MKHTTAVILLAYVVACCGLNCPANTCKSLGQSCTTSPTPNTANNVCTNGLYCTGTCQTTKGQGTVCASDYECSENLGCVSITESCSSGSSSQPQWMQGHGLNEWFTIPGTSGAGGSAVGAYSGFAFNELTNEIFIGLAGGHSDSADNRVVSLKITDDEPKWVQRCAPSANFTIDVAYYSDGKPSARHTYQNIFFVPQVNRLMFFGARFTYGNAYGWPEYVDAWNPSTNTWDPKDTWAHNPSRSYGTVMIKSTGEVFNQGLDKWSPNNNWTLSPYSRLREDNLRHPVVHDPVRNQLFNLQWADGESYGRQNITASRIPVNGKAQIEVTFNPSAALTQFLDDKPTYAGMDYDPDNDRFLFYSGTDSAVGRIYTITPNNGSVWDMGILPLGPNSVTPLPTPGAGVNNKFRYIPALKGFVMLGDKNANMSFIRTSDASCNGGTSTVRKCLPAISGPGMTCSQDSECYFYNSSIGAKQKSTCVNTKCYGLTSGATCTGANQCNQGLVCKGATCTVAASAGQSCADQSECQAGLFCKKTTKDGTAKVCVAYAKGTSGSYCEDSAFCGDNLYCNLDSMTCAASTQQGNCNCSCANPSGFASAVADLETCWQSNPSCKKAIPCSSCTTQICALYALSPSFLSETCTDATTKKAALQACPVAPTSGSSSKTTTTLAAASTSTASKTTTSGSATSSQPGGTSSSSQSGSSTTGTSPIESSGVASIYVSIALVGLCVAAIL